MGLTAFASWLVIKFFWNIAAMHLAISDNSTLQDIGQGMAFF
jgi:hypothetical protein